MAGKVKVTGYAQRKKFEQGIEYRNFTDDLVGQQAASTTEALPYSLTNIFDSEFSTQPRIAKQFIKGKFSNFITLTDIDLDDLKIKELIGTDSKLYLNLNKRDFLNYATFGSLTEFLRVSLEDIIINWPASIYLREYDDAYNILTTVEDYTYQEIEDKATFKVNVNNFINPFNVIYVNVGSQLSANTLTKRNLTLSYVPTGITTGDYNIATTADTFNILDFTASTSSINDYVYFEVVGNPFPTLSATTSGSFTYHVKPTNEKQEAFFNELNDFESHLLNRFTVPKYKSVFNIELIHESGNIVKGVKSYIWPTSDGYNLDYQSSLYIDYVKQLLELTQELDKDQTDLIHRFLVSESITSFDSIPLDENADYETEAEKITKTLRIYGREFDEIKRYIDGISLAHTVSYNKEDNIPDGLVKTLAQTLGWELTNSIISNDLLTSFLAPSDTLYSGHSRGMSAFESEIEFWRRLVINTPWIWKSKGTRKAVEFLMKFIGTPQGLIDFNEYVYVAQNQINYDLFSELYRLNTDNDNLSEVPLSSDGYPSPLADTPYLYFQNDGLWYQETAGTGATIDKLIGNNPHVGPYDGGSKYMSQFNCLIPDFTSTTIVQETIVSATTNLFTNYNGGTFNDAFSYNAAAICNLSSGGFSDYLTLFNSSIIGYCTRSAGFGYPGSYTGTQSDCIISGDYSVHIYVDGNLSYNGSSIGSYSGTVGNFSNTALTYSTLVTELQNAATTLGYTTTFVNDQVHFVQTAGFGYCDPLSIVGTSFSYGICFDYTMNCDDGINTFSGTCAGCSKEALYDHMCETEFETYGSISDIYVDVYDSNNNPSSSSFTVTTEAIKDPFPAPEQTDCGCDPSDCDNALKICISKPIDIFTDCQIDSSRELDGGLVLFTVNGLETYSVSEECCKGAAPAGSTYTYGLYFNQVSKYYEWGCYWDQTGNYIPSSQFDCSKLSFHSKDLNGVVTFNYDSGLITVLPSTECCTAFNYVGQATSGGYNCVNTG